MVYVESLDNIMSSEHWGVGWGVRKGVGKGVGRGGDSLYVYDGNAVLALSSPSLNNNTLKSIKLTLQTQPEMKGCFVSVGSVLVSYLANPSSQLPY